MNKFYLPLAAILLLCLAPMPYGYSARGESGNGSVFVDRTICPGPNDTSHVEEYDEGTISGSRRNIEVIMQSIVEGDAKKLASLTIYPISRSYPLRDIENAKQMEERFASLFDKRFRQRLKNAKVSDWESVGWRGWTFGNGLLWVYDSLIQINYYSEKELQMKEQLVVEEIESLHPSLQKGWKPSCCFVDQQSRDILRIDIKKEKCRLAIYHPHSDLRGLPDLLLYGHKETGGTIGSYSHYYSDKKGNRVEIDEFSDQCLYILEGKEETHTLKRQYWQDLRDAVITLDNE